MMKISKGLLNALEEAREVVECTAGSRHEMSKKWSAAGCMGAVGMR